MANDKSAIKVVLIQDPQTQAVNKARIDGHEIPVMGASPIMQGGQIGVSLTLVGVELSGETAPAPAMPALPGQPA